MVPTLLRRVRGLSNPVESILQWRSNFGFGVVEISVLLGYFAVLVAVVPHHERWSDEAQAWLLARDNSVWELLRYRLHYEGWPGLWHIILKAFQAMGGQYSQMNWLGCTFATAGIAVFLRWAPFPLIIRVLLPFTFFLQYQYAIIARGYTLFPLLAFGLCALFHRRAHVVLFGVVAGLLANVSLQGTVFSFMMMYLYLTHDDMAVRLASQKTKRFIAAGLYLMLLIFAAWTAAPAPDTGISGGPPVTTGYVHDLLERYPGPLPEDQKIPAPRYPLTRTVAASPVPPPVSTPVRLYPEPSYLYPTAWITWYSHGGSEALGNDSVAKRYVAPTLITCYELLTLATGPLSTYKFAACGFLMIVILWLFRQRSLRVLIPWLANIFVGEALWMADHHTGMLFISIICAIWLAAPQFTSFHRSPDKLDLVLIASLSIICVLQIGWTISASRKDIHLNYDPSTDTARFILNAKPQRLAGFDFMSVGVSPYFTANPFYNFRHSYWVWATTDNPNGAHVSTIEQDPDMVLFAQDLLQVGFMHNDWAPLSPINAATQDEDLRRNPIILDLQQHGYRETHRFCGDRFMRLSASYRTCHLIFEPITKGHVVGLLPDQ